MDARALASSELANLTRERSKWFRTRHVLIPWGCDYMYQDANLTFSATDELLSTINAHTASWGVHAQYGTASTYLDAVRTAAGGGPSSGPATAVSSFGGTATVSPDVATAAAATAASASGVTFPVVGAGTSFFPYAPAVQSAARIYGHVCYASSQ